MILFVIFKIFWMLGLLATYFIIIEIELFFTILLLLSASICCISGVFFMIKYISYFCILMACVITTVIFIGISGDYPIIMWIGEPISLLVGIIFICISQKYTLNINSKNTSFIKN